MQLAKLGSEEGETRRAHACGAKQRKTRKPASLRALTAGHEHARRVIDRQAQKVSRIRVVERSERGVLAKRAALSLHERNEQRPQ